jgi:xylan 1,4-beta-xylosidase
MIKRFLLLASALCLAACTSAVPRGVAEVDWFEYQGQDDFYVENPLPGGDYAYNPLLPGWFSDPSICTDFKGNYYLVTSTFSYFPGVPIFHSTDLLNWEQKGYVLTRESQLVNLGRQHISGGIFAPDIQYNPHNETFYMITTNVGAGNFVVKAKNPLGEWSDPIMLPEVQGIDPSLFFDEDGRAYIVHNDDAPDRKPEYDGHRTIRIIEYDVENDCTVGEEKIVVNKGVNPAEKPIWIEGPHLYKINGRYMIMAAEGGTGLNHSEVVFSSDSPTGPFVPWKGNPILTQRHLPADRPNPVTCTGHADLVQTPQGEWWAVFLACRPIGGDFENLGRETFMLPVRWSEDGFPVITKGNELVSMTVRHEGTRRSDKVTFGNFNVRDDFDGDALSVDWMTLRSSASDLYSVENGALKLKCSEARSTEFATPALVLRRVQHHKFTASARIRFAPAAGSSEAAGMLLFKDEVHQYFLKAESGKISLEKSGKTELASAALSQYKYLDLKVVSDGLTFSFWYAPNGGQWKLLKDNVSAKFLSTAATGGFTGTTIGLYAIK